MKSRAITRLTNDGSGTLLNGEPDWVYPEELELETAHWWSPDSRSIAYLQFDISREPVFPQVSLLNARGVMEPERYPKAGDPNAAVRLGIITIPGGPTKWMELGPASDNLLARVVWSPNSRQVMAERLNRIQNKLDLLLADIQTGAAKTVVHEEDRVLDPTCIWRRSFWGRESGSCGPANGRAFCHLYIYGVDGRQQAQLTSGNWEVDKLVGVDEVRRRVYYTSTEAGPMERQIYSVAFNGYKRRLSAAPGTHAASLSPDGAYFVDDYSSVASPMRSILCTADDGKEVAVYREAPVDQHNLQAVETVTVNTADGATLFAHLIKPAGFDAAKKYPARS